MLGRDKRVLMIGAHPDDEDTELLTVLVRGLGAEAAYLSLNRGEGGQNLIGPELGEALGLIRTEELLAARRLDGARQYFTRAYDFGYSKTLEETWRHWPRDTVLKDVVRIVRRFRPQVIVSIFSGTPRDGHGQHQAAGWAAREAFQAAGDATRFPELAREEGSRRGRRSSSTGPPGSTRRPRRSARGRGARPGVGTLLSPDRDGGRSLHRSQDMGRLQGLGPSRVRLALIEDRTGRGGEGLFSGIDTTAAAGGPPPGSAVDLAGAWSALRSRWSGGGRAGRPPGASRPRRPRRLRRRLRRPERRRPSGAGAAAGVTFECWNTGAVPHRVIADCGVPGSIRPDSGAVTLELAPGELGAGG